MIQTSRYGRASRTVWWGLLWLPPHTAPVTSQTCYPETLGKRVTVKATAVVLRMFFFLLFKFFYFNLSPNLCKHDVYGLVQ